MNLLLDTCAFLWIAKNDANLSPAALEAFRCADNAVFLSSVSAWEISIKWSMGKLALPYPPPQFIPRERKRAFYQQTAIHRKRHVSFDKPAAFAQRPV
jgi:PIN domain nuclease of toxin-antitoxin system